MRKTLIKMAAVAAVLASSLVWLSCGDTYRPIITPFPQPGGDPQASGRAIVLNTGGASAGGALNTIDVSGDTDIADAYVGTDPVSMLMTVASVYTVNRGSKNLTLVSSFSPTATPTTITLPTGSDPGFAAISGSTVYVTDVANNAVQIVSSGSVNTGSVPVGTNPLGVVATPDGTKVYVVNQGSDNVSVITTQTQQVTATIAVGSSPVYAAVSADSKWVMVAEQGAGKVALINTADNSVSELSAGAGTSYVTYDNHLKRFYAVNTTGNSISVYDETAATPVLLRTVAVGSGPTSVAVLSDGSRAYTANQGDGTVSVVDVNSFTKTKDITVATGGQQVMWVAASANATKVYAAVKGTNDTSDPGFTAVIPTASDTVLIKIAPPRIDPNCNPATSPTPCTYTQPIYVAAQ